MKIILSKIQAGQWNVKLNGEVIGEARTSVLRGGSYIAKLNNGAKVLAFSQEGLKSIIVKELTKESV